MQFVKYPMAIWGSLLLNAPVLYQPIPITNDRLFETFHLSWSLLKNFYILY